MLKRAVNFVIRASGDLLGLVGVLLLGVCAVAFLALLGVQLTSGALSPYFGIVTYMALPAGFLTGLVLLIVSRWRVRRALSHGRPVPWQLDLANPTHRERLGAFAVVAVVSVIVLALSTYHGVHYMDSTAFCGQVCHTVMEPEFTAYQNSPHARVSCTDCHIGPGASWFVKSKLSGSRQVLAVALGNYPKPVPAPIDNLRPARETCEQCHWPEKFHGDRMKIHSRFQADEANTELKTVLVLKVGGGSLESGFAAGIHWHMNLANHIDYRASPDRAKIYWIRVEDLQGNVREYWKEEGLKREEIAQLPMRRMDCMDCHNRPTHEFDRPEFALDAALQTQQISPDLPYVKREGLRLLKVAHATKEEGLSSFEPGLLAFYERDYPEIASSRRADIQRAAAALQAIYGRNIFPAMNVTWNTYPNHIGHQDDGGCYRCHDEAHRTDAGVTISQDCSTCHALVALEEKDPEALKVLLGQQ